MADAQFVLLSLGLLPAFGFVISKQKSTMKTIALSIVSALAASLMSQAQELRTITETSGPLEISPDAIVQIVGVSSGSITTANSGFTLPSMTQTFADGTKVKNHFCQGILPSMQSTATNNNLV